ncbi:MAG: DUF1460 domain-containing protein [Nanoarchaeota archaeon]|nr:DUF1460 domain-containing protein [Nanoarchaeota archaeon]MBU1320966.1 DUF1460 domain-containing protein [Nanoarchaeota archaeon]MBU1598351.1 DUF1460 domain-containing protein [Nanoarchaeota archaeon]MBU2441747.1 DUF1460 domain-containing protein [Nanoarchaeota archaeon]
MIGKIGLVGMLAFFTPAAPCFTVAENTVLVEYVRNENISLVENLGKWNKETLTDLIKKSKHYPDLGERLLFISDSFADIPYKPNTLGGGPDKKESLTVDLTGMDCFTSVEYFLAMANANDFNDFLNVLRKIRYVDDGKTVSWYTRNHFSVDWIKQNSEFASDITTRFDYDFNTRTLNILEAKGIPAKKVILNYIPKEKIPDMKAELKTGDIVFFAKNQAGLDVGHVGILKISDNSVFLRHHSSDKGRMVDEDLQGYISRIRSFYGIIIARPE